MPETKLEDISKISDKDKTELTNKLVKEALGLEQHFILIFGSDDNVHCQSNVVGHGDPGLLAHCIIEVLRVDQELKNHVLQGLTAMMMGEMFGEMISGKDCECPNCKKSETPEQNSPTTNSKH